MVFYMSQVKQNILNNKKEEGQNPITLQTAKPHQYDNSLLCAWLAINPCSLRITCVDLVLFWFLCAAQHPKHCRSLTVSYQPNLNLSNNLFEVHLVRSAFYRYMLISTDCTEALERWVQRAIRKFSIRGCWLMMTDHISWWCWYSRIDIYKHYQYLYLQM